MTTYLNDYICSLNTSKLYNNLKFGKVRNKKFEQLVRNK